MIGVFQLWFLLIPYSFSCVCCEVMLQGHRPSDPAQEAAMAEPGTGSIPQFPLECLPLGVSPFSWFPSFVSSCRWELHCSLGCGQRCWGVFVTAAATFPCPEHQPEGCGARAVVHPPQHKRIPWENAHGKNEYVSALGSSFSLWALSILLCRYLCDFCLCLRAGTLLSVKFSVFGSSGTP